AGGHVGEQRLVVLPVGVLLGGGRSGRGGTGGLLAEDAHVTPLQAHVPTLGVLLHGGLGVLGPALAVGAAVVGVDNHAHRCVGRAGGHRVALDAADHVGGLHRLLRCLGRRWLLVTG